VAVDAEITEKPKRTPLIEGRQMRCPRCELLHDILRYIPVQQIEKYAEETNPVYRCPSCRWIFSPSPHVIEVFI
jgi:uncharacterized protein with PIN domain